MVKKEEVKKEEVKKALISSVKIFIEAELLGVKPKDLSNAIKSVLKKEGIEWE